MERRCNYLECGGPIVRGGHQCLSCGRMSWPRGVDGSDPSLVSLADVDEAENSERLRTGPQDVVWGGPRRPGIKRTCVYLLSGGPGSGKSTLVLQTIEPILTVVPDCPALYLGNEQGADELKEQAIRLGLRHFDRILVPKIRGSIEYPLSDAVLACDPCVVVQDSLPGVEGADLADSLEILIGLKDVAIAGRPVFVVNHVNADGDVAGLTDFQHAVDATFMLRPVVVERGRLVTRRGSTVRRFEAYKNRTGREAAITLDMTDYGLSAHSADCDCDVCVVGAMR